MIRKLLVAILTMTTPAALHAQNYASQNSCSGLRQPADVDELELRCDLLGSAIDNMRTYTGGYLTFEAAQPILAGSGIDPEQDAACWGLPFSTLGHAFRNLFNVGGYQQELGCPTNPDLTVYGTQWNQAADTANRCLISITSDFETFISVDIDLSRNPASFSIATGNGPGGNVPQSVMVDELSFTTERSIGYAIEGDVAKQAVIAMLSGTTVRNVPMGRTVVLGDFAKKLAVEIAKLQDCPGFVPNFLPIDTAMFQSQVSSPEVTSEPVTLSTVISKEPLDWESTLGMVTYWIELGDEKVPKLTIDNTECRIVIWLTNVVVDGYRPPVTEFRPSDSSVTANPQDTFELTFEFSANPMVIDAFQTTQVSSEQEAERLIEYYSEPKDRIDLQLAIRKHWDDDGPCYAEHTLEYVRPE